MIVGVWYVVWDDGLFVFVFYLFDVNSLKLTADLQRQSESQLQTARDALTANHLRSMTELQTKLQGTASELGVAMTVISRHETKLLAAEQKISGLESEIRDREVDWSRTKQQLLDSHRKELAELESKHRGDLDRAATDKHDSLKAIAEKASAAVMDCEARHAMTQSRLDEVTKKYLARESRPEDLQRMQQLLMTIADQEKLVKRAVDEMKYYKLELLNREENYNKTFGRTPKLNNNNNHSAGMGVGGMGMGMGMGMAGVGSGGGGGGGLTDRLGVTSAGGGTISLLIGDGGGAGGVGKAKTPKAGGSNSGGGAPLGTSGSASQIPIVSTNATASAAGINSGPASAKRTGGAVPTATGSKAIGLRNAMAIGMYQIESSNGKTESLGLCCLCCLCVVCCVVCRRCDRRRSPTAPAVRYGKRIRW